MTRYDIYQVAENCEEWCEYVELIDDSAAFEHCEKCARGFYDGGYSNIPGHEDYANPNDYEFHAVPEDGGDVVCVAVGDYH